MRLNHALRGRRAVIVAAATVALGAVASPAFARARYQLQLNEGRKLLGA